jgi:hypothetical protein
VTMGGTIVRGGDVANIGIGGLQRPNLVGSIPSLNCQENTTSRELINCFDPTAFAVPADFTFGNAGRNILRGPKSVQTDLSLSKTIDLAGTTRIQVRAEMFNVFNNVNFGNPNATLGSANFGRISGAGAMRQVQLGVKLMF